MLLEHKVPQIMGHCAVRDISKATNSLPASKIVQNGGVPYPAHINDHV